MAASFWNSFGRKFCLLAYLELKLHVSIQLCHKVLFTHAEQGFLVLFWQIIPIFCQSLKQQPAVVGTVLACC